MDASLNTHLSIAAVALAGASLFFSLVAAFPGLKGVVAAVRDGVLWFALFMLLGGVGFVVWQHLQQVPRSAPTASTRPVAEPVASQGASR